MKTSSCRSCGAPVIWATTRAGKAMPVDAAPRSDGNIELVLNDVEGSPPIACYLKEGYRELPDGTRYHVAERYVSHFVSCAQAKDWRRKG